MLLDVEEVLASLSTLLHFAESSWVRFVALPDLVRTLRRLVTFDQPLFVHQSSLFAAPIVLTSRCRFLEASSVQSSETTLFYRHDVIRVTAPRS